MDLVEDAGVDDGGWRVSKNIATIFAQSLNFSTLDPPAPERQGVRRNVFYFRLLANGGFVCVRPEGVIGICRVVSDSDHCLILATSASKLVGMSCSSSFRVVSIRSYTVS